MAEIRTDPLIVILGPTASGKTALAIALAKKLNAEIISADSRQVYQSMDIGTGKDLADYQNIPHHLINIIPPGEQYNLSCFQNDFHEAYDEIRSQNKSAILCGGSGMYIQAVLQNFQLTNIPKNEKLRIKLKSATLDELKKELKHYPETSSYSINPSSKRQLIRAIETRLWKINNSSATQKCQSSSIPHLIFGLAPDSDVRRKRITLRLIDRLEQGLIEEVKNLLGIGVSPEQLIYYGLEYKWSTLYLQNEITYEVFFSKLETAIHQFAKRQMTYFRKMEKDGLKIQWLNNDEETEEHLNMILQKRMDLLNQST